MNRSESRIGLQRRFAHGNLFQHWIASCGCALLMLFGSATIPNANASLCVLELNPALRSHSNSSDGFVLILPDSLSILEISSQWDANSPRGRAVTLSHGASYLMDHRDENFVRPFFLPESPSLFDLENYFKLTGMSGDAIEIKRKAEFYFKDETKTKGLAQHFSGQALYPVTSLAHKLAARSFVADDPLTQIEMNPFQLANYGMNRFFEFIGPDGEYFGRVLDIFDKTGNYDNDNTVRSLSVLVELQSKNSGESKLALLGNLDLGKIFQNEKSKKTAYDAFEKRLNSKQKFNRALLSSIVPQPLIDKPLKFFGDIQTWALGNQGLAENGSLDFPTTRYSNKEALANWPSDRLLNWAVDLDGTFRLMIGVLASDLGSDSHLFLTTGQKPALLGGYLSIERFAYNPGNGRGIWHVNLAIDVEYFSQAVKQNMESGELDAKIRAIFEKEIGDEIQIHKIILARKIKS